MWQRQMITMGDLLILEWYDEQVQETYIFRNTGIYNTAIFFLQGQI